MRRRPRIALAVLAALLTAGASGCAGPREPLVVASFGGAWQEAQREAMFAPFEAASGVPVRDVEYDGAYALVEEHGGAGDWHLIDVEPAELLRGAAAGLYEEIDYSGIDREALIDSAVHPYGVGLMTYAIVLGWDTGAFGEGEDAPHTWSDFWDLERFPGKRALRDSPQWMLEIALLADGVPPDALYPLDLDRAFASLDAIRDAVVVFDAWSEPAELLARGGAAMAVGTNGRLLSARRQGEPVAISWHNGLIASDYFVIPKGSPRKAEAQALIDLAVGLEAQSRFPRSIDYGPVNLRALDALPADVLPRLPTSPENLDGAVIFDAGWWLENEAAAVTRYQAWLAGLAG